MRDIFTSLERELRFFILSLSYQLCLYKINKCKAFRNFIYLVNKFFIKDNNKKILQKYPLQYK